MMVPKIGNCGIIALSAKKNFFLINKISLDLLFKKLGLLLIKILKKNHFFVNKIFKKMIYFFKKKLGRIILWFINNR
jgi:hypothetical protein